MVRVDADAPGPSALKIMTLADVETDDEKEKMSVAEFLTVGLPL